MKPFIVVGIISLFLIQGCYYSAQSYNHGKLLNPGDAMFSLGVGGYFASAETDESYYNYYSDEYVYNAGMENKYWRHIALNYQLGVHDRYPFGGGVEIGLHSEFSYYKTNYGRGSDVMPLVDFNTRLGFKDIVRSNFVYQHNVELGWTPGTWVDNGWFLGYAGGWEFPKMIPYWGIRGVLRPTSLLETDFGDYEDEDTFLGIKSDQKFNLRGAVGVSFKLPKKRVLPDYITPEFTLIAPHATPYDNFTGTFHVALRWTNGI